MSLSCNWKLAAQWTRNGSWVGSWWNGIPDMKLSEEVVKNCCYISVCNSEAISPMVLTDGHSVHTVQQSSRRSGVFSSMCTVATAADHGNKSMRSAKIGGVRHVASKTDIGQLVELNKSESCCYTVLQCSCLNIWDAGIGRLFFSHDDVCMPMTPFWRVCKMSASWLHQEFLQTNDSLSAPV